MQSALVEHGSAVHTPIVPSSFEQYLPVAQWVVPRTLRQPATHVPVVTWEVSQTSSVGQLVSPEQPVTHVCDVVLQTSPATVQSPLPTQATHVFETESHFGVVPLHDVESTHPTHWPTFTPVVTHAAPPAVPVQSAAFAHARQI